MEKASGSVKEGAVCRLRDWIWLFKKGALLNWDLKFQPHRWSREWVSLARGTRVLG